MVDLKCETCRTRFRIDDRPPTEVLCPGCNSPLEPPSQLAELVGFQRARFEDQLPDANSEFLVAVAMALSQPGTER